MEIHNNSLSELGKLEQIVSQFLLKSLHIILDSRIPSLHPHDCSGELSSVPLVKKRDRWFNLILGDRPAGLDKWDFCCRNVMDPIIIDIILVHEGLGSSSVDNFYGTSPVGSSVETVIERWVLQYEIPRVVVPHCGEHSASASNSYKKTYKKTYKKSIILLRSLYSQMRLLPAYRVLQKLSTFRQTGIICNVSSFSVPFSRAEEELMEKYSFTPIEDPHGRLCISVTYRSRLSDFNLDSSTMMPSKIITDCFEGPATEPHRSFSSSEFRAASFPLRGVSSPSSWSYLRNCDLQCKTI